jgi:hypothetical protein
MASKSVVCDDCILRSLLKISTLSWAVLLIL